MNKFPRWLGIAMVAVVSVSMLGLLSGCGHGSGAAIGGLTGAIVGAVIGDSIEHDYYGDPYYYDDPYYYKAGPAEYDSPW